MNPFLKKLSLYLRLKTRDFGSRFMKVPQPEKWVFITGCYNSGTTLLHKVLASHPQVGSMPNEGQFFTNQLPRGADIGMPRLWALKPEYFRLNESNIQGPNPEILKKNWAYFYNDVSKHILIEKTIANSARTRWLQKNFQNSYFITLFRNGYAVAEGIRRKENHDWEKAVTQWKVSNEILIEDIPYLKNHMSVHYEELTDNPEKIFSDITSFLGINPLDATVLQSEFNIHKVRGSIRNMNEESFRNLTENDIRYFNSNAEEIMKKLGYELIQLP